MGHRTTHNRTHRLTRRSALRGHTLSSREERVWRKTRQRTHGSLETPSLCGYRLRLDVSVPSTCALVPSPNSNQRRCSRASSDLLTEEQCRSTPWKLMSGKAFSSTGSPPLRAYCAPEVVRSNTVGSPLGETPPALCATSRVVDGSVSLVFAQGRKARSLRISSFPQRTRRTGWASAGPPNWGNLGAAPFLFFYLFFLISSFFLSPLTGEMGDSPEGFSSPPQKKRSGVSTTAILPLYGI